MAKQSNKRPKGLSEGFLRTVKKPGVFGDGRGRHGLQARVTIGADGKPKIYFQQRLTFGNRRINVGIGPYGFITLAEARAIVFENAKLARQGNDPRVVRKLKNEGVPTFSEAAEMVITERAKDWKDGSSTEDVWRGILRREAFPKIGHMRVDAIDENDIVEMLEPLWNTKRATATVLFGYAREIMAWCKRKRHIGHNPVTDAVREHAPRTRNRVRHQPFVPYYQMRDTLMTIRGYRGGLTTKLALLFQIYTACRHGSARNATWQDIDWENAVWNIPAEHMKMDRPHRVPLSSGAVAVLTKALELRREDSDLVFPSSHGGGVIGNATLAAMCRRLNLPGVPHGVPGDFCHMVCRDGSTTGDCGGSPRAHAQRRSTSIHPH